MRMDAGRPLVWWNVCLGESMSLGPVARVVSEYGASAKAKLSGIGEPEEALRVPLEKLIVDVGALSNRAVVMEGEARLVEVGARPDFAVRVNGAIVGYLEVKKPGLSIAPASFTGDNRRQWDRLSGLPNLIYTNGTVWRLYRFGELISETSLVGGPIASAGADLSTDGPDFEELLSSFLFWTPDPIRSTQKLVSVVAPLTRLLREKVVEQLLKEHVRVKGGADPDQQVFLGLAGDWRALLFPEATDEAFADGYAQTVTFALLLARTEGMRIGDADFHTIGEQLMLGHSLMGRSLQLLTERLEPGFGNTIELLGRVIDVVEWDDVRKSKDTYLHLYEHFLEAYDPDLRKATGTYYTPHQIVDEMVRLTEEVLRNKLSRPAAFLDEAVTTIDPAMGTGTFLHAVIESVAATLLETEGPGLVAGGVGDVAKRLVGFEKQLGSYAVAQLRTTDLLRSYAAAIPDGGLPMYVADTLSDPTAAEQQIASGLGAISASRKAANRYKADVPVTVVIGNPPYGAKAEGAGGWIEAGTQNASGNGTGAPPLSQFRLAGNGSTEFSLKNLYVYFWRWATWKVFESTPQEQAGVVTYITSSAYVSGPGFKGMRKYLRENASEGWIIDLSPEGKRPPSANAIFAIETPVAIGIFIRRPDNDTAVPAPIHFRTLSGTRQEKFNGLAALTLGDDGWVDAHNDWTAPFTPAPGESWLELPLVDSVFPWRGPGIAANRTWVYSPSREILTTRWMKIVGETDYQRKKALFRESRDATLEKTPLPLPGSDTFKFTGPFKNETSSSIEPVRVGFRTFDRQWVIPDTRILHAPSPPLWSARVDGQVFMGEQHSVTVPVGSSPLSFSALITDLNFTDNRGGRAVPMLHPNGDENIAPGLIEALTVVYGFPVTGRDVFSYVAGVVAHGGFTEAFQEPLRTPGARIPLTVDGSLFQSAAELGRTVIWLHSFGEAFADPTVNRVLNDPRSGINREDRIFSITPVTVMPVTFEHDDESSQLRFIDEQGNISGSWGPVRKEVLEFKIGHLSVIESWFGYRRKEPYGKTSSDLDAVLPTSWPSSWSVEFTNLLTVVSRLIDAEQEQRKILTDILSGDLFSITQLADLGVRWPSAARSDHGPRKAVTKSESQLDGLNI